MGRPRQSGKAFFLVVLVFMASLCWSHNALGDGGMLFHDPELLEWKLQKMNKQLCAIHYENGLQNMFLSIYMNDLMGERAAWIFPVPAVPDRISIGITKNFPSFYGANIQNEAKGVINRVFAQMRLTQIYSLPLDSLFFLRRGLQGRFFEGVEIHDHIENMGLTTEILTAQNAEQLVAYLKRQSLDLPADFRSVLEEYIGKEYSFVISWIVDVKKFKEEARKEHVPGESFNSLSVSIDFPTDKIFFPVRLTSVYGDVRIPMTVYVVGHVTPEVDSKIQNNSRVNYFSKSGYIVDPEFRSFFSGKELIKDFKYTEVIIDAPSKDLLNDLWMSPRTPLKVQATHFIGRGGWVWGVLIFMFVSCLSSLLAGVLTFRKDQPRKVKFAVFGLWNFLTLIGMTLAANHFKIDNVYTQKNQRPQAQVLFWKALEVAAMISGSLCITFFGLVGFYASNQGHPEELVVPFLITFLLITILLIPFTHIFMKNRFLRNYIVLFTIFFMLITTLCQICLQWVLGLWWV